MKATYHPPHGLLRFIREPDGAHARSCDSLESNLMRRDAQFDRERFKDFLVRNRAARAIVSFEECDNFLAKVAFRVGAFSRQSAESLIKFYDAVEKKPTVPTVTNALQRMRDALRNEYEKLIKEEI